MKKYVEVLKKCPLFRGIDEADLLSLLTCLNAKEKTVQKDEFVMIAGDTPEDIGVVLSGGVHIVQEDYWGNRAILSAVQTGGLFAEAFACSDAASLPVSVVARENCDILFVDCKRILTVCSSSCTFHTMLIHNLTKVLAGKNIMLTRKMEHITKKTTREKVLSYLSECAIKAGTDSFDIPFDRQELADYLAVERSALSKTLCSMRDEGVLEFRKNRFSLNIMKS